MHAELNGYDVTWPAFILICLTATLATCFIVEKVMKWHESRKGWILDKPRPKRKPPLRPPTVIAPKCKSHLQKWPDN